MTSTTLALSLLLVACGHAEPAAPVTPASPAPTPAPEASGSGTRALTRTTVAEAPAAPDASGPLDVHVRVRAKHDKAVIEVAPDATLHTRDYVELLVSANARAYLYVVQVFPDGSSDVLFPSEGDLRVEPGATMRVPTAATEWFQLDDVVGTETVYVVASREPIAKVDEALGKEIGQIRAANPSPTVAAKPAPTPVKPKPQPTRARPERMLSMASRSLHRVTKVEGAPEVSASAASKDETFVVARFSFHHEH